MSVLLAVDLRHHPETVLDTAKDWLNTYGKPVHLAYIDEYRSTQPFVQDAQVQFLLNAEWEKMAVEDRERLQALLDTLPENLRGGIHLSTGPAAAGINKLAKDHEMVIVATHGRKGFTHFWLGSVAEKVVRSCSVPVLVLRLPSED